MKKALLFIILIIAYTSGYCQEQLSAIEFHAVTDKSVYKQGEPIAITLYLTNRDTKDIKLFHPDTLGKSWVGCELGLECRVRRPGGSIILLEPDMRFEASYAVEAQYFKVLTPGDALGIPLRFKGNKFFDPVMKTYSNKSEGNEWVGLIEIGPHQANISDEDVRRRWGIKGDYGFLSGTKDYIIVRQLLSDVFNSPGQYQLDFEYVNNCNFASSADRQGNVDQWDKVTDAWTGKLEASVSFEIQD
ncbi:MAG: hypothetical protein PHQ96_08870 [Candidatus Omnitrophica bacterium]|nr:hypothetical protein [Candidatus Omnitrophota bacterium]